MFQYSLPDELKNFRGKGKKNKLVPGSRALQSASFAEHATFTLYPVYKMFRV